MFAEPLKNQVLRYIRCIMISFFFLLFYSKHTKEVFNVEQEISRYFERFKIFRRGKKAPHSNSKSYAQEMSYRDLYIDTSFIFRCSIVIKSSPFAFLIQESNKFSLTHRCIVGSLVELSRRKKLRKLPNWLDQIWTYLVWQYVSEILERLRRWAEFYWKGHFCNRLSHFSKFAIFIWDVDVRIFVIFKKLYNQILYYIFCKIIELAKVNWICSKRFLYVERWIKFCSFFVINFVSLYTF